MVVDDDHRLMLQAPADRPEPPRIELEPLRRILLASMAQIGAILCPAHTVLDELFVLSGQTGEIGQQRIVEDRGI
ncbi:hypothetical protein D3C72_2219290 [compost metagenome]